MGQWLSPDPAFDGLNLYAYVHNNPINMVDPLGLSAEAKEWTHHYEGRPTTDSADHEGNQTIAFSNDRIRGPGQEEFAALQRSAQAHAESYANADKGGMMSLRNEPIPVTDTSGFHTTAFAVTTGIVNLAELGVAAGGILAAGRVAAATKGVASAERLAIGRGKDLASGLKAGETKLQWPSKLPDFKAEWKMNSGFLRQWMQKGQPIRDVSPGDTGGVFLNAERNLLQSRGWTFDSGSGYWLPPGG